MLSENHILKLLSYASDDLPTLENRCHKLGSDAVELQITKKQLGNEVAGLNSQIYRLEKLRKQYHIDIQQKRQIILNLDQQLNQKIDALEKAS